MKFMRHNKWQFLNELRLEYAFDESSVVFDIGAYKGEFAQKIYDMYNCKVIAYEPVREFYRKIPSAIISYNLAVSNRIGYGTIYVNKDSSSTHTPSEVYRKQTIKYITMGMAMHENNIRFIDLLKINIEGDEYDLIDYMIDKKYTAKCQNIQVQFHRIGNFMERYNIIRYELEKTHQLTFRIPFVWENWQLLS